VYVLYLNVPSSDWLKNQLISVVSSLQCVLSQLNTIKRVKNNNNSKPLSFYLESDMYVLSFYFITLFTNPVQGNVLQYIH